TKSSRTIPANGSGVFVFPGLDSGDYSVSIRYKGFKEYALHSIHLNPNDTRNLTNIRLTPGEVSEVVNVDATAALPVEDDGSRSALITSKDLSKLSLDSREVTELLKSLPGAAINNGVNGGSADSNVTY